VDRAGGSTRRLAGSDSNLGPFSGACTGHGRLEHRCLVAIAAHAVFWIGVALNGMLMLGLLAELVSLLTGESSVDWG
jgi:hypothetical protein